MGADKPGWSKSEKTIGENLDQMIGNVKGRCIVATFASNVGRVIQIIQSAVKHGRVVFLNGRSLLNYTDVARELGYITAPKDSVRKLDASMDGMHDDKVLLLSTGAQGEEMSALARMSR